MSNESLGEIVLKGIPVSSGICQGKILVIGRIQPRVECRRITPAEVNATLKRFQDAIIKTKGQILDTQKRVLEKMGGKDASIFDAHLLMLEDPLLIEEVKSTISDENYCAEYAFHLASEKYIKALSTVEDELLRERVADLQDVRNRVLNNLLGREQESFLPNLKEPCIIVSHDLSPSTTAMLDRNKVIGFATDLGSQTSHTAILARSLQIPAIVGLQNASFQLSSGQFALLDGHNGILIINPTDYALFIYGKFAKKKADLQERLADLRSRVSVTLDGKKVTLLANIERPEEVDNVLKFGAEGIGLFRTEYLFLNRKDIPGEEEQYEAYYKVANALKPQPVVIRTLDIGGDKFISEDKTPEVNSFLGCRAIRFCLEKKDIFRAQLRAILRASSTGNVKMMYPMISRLEEVLEANQLVEECKQQLLSEGKQFNNSIDIGVMIEVPSAVMISDTLAKYARFFSLGTNDLIQYSLAIDRLNEKVAYLYQPTSPAIIKMIKAVVEAAHKKGITVCVCGEMAGDASLVPLLIGLGIDELSVAIAVVPQIKYIITRMRLSEAQVLAQFAIESESATDILNKCTDYSRSIAPELFEHIENNNNNH
ncbi:MAG TPA: phosphoenolpyruvate--protein phosphotransferase [Verrucomicrobiota bacterium]|nr:phosphoenolpyruvate--protein phosphotransferase [Verrucomicrobiota bacterium]